MTWCHLRHVNVLSTFSLVHESVVLVLSFIFFFLVQSMVYLALTNSNLKQANCDKQTPAVKPRCQKESEYLLPLIKFRRWYFLFFSIWVFFSFDIDFTHHSMGRQKPILTNLYHFHLRRKHLDISKTITAESSPLSVVSDDRTQTRNLWLPNKFSEICTFNWEASTLLFTVSSLLFRNISAQIKLTWS